MIEEIRLEGATLADVGYTHETEGSFNVTKILASLDRAMKVRFPINDSIIAANALADVCRERINSMTPEEARLPIVLMGCENGTAFVVDGNNRLRWLIEHGEEEARAYFVPYEDREQFRMRIMIREGGVWREENHGDALEKMMGKHSPLSATPAEKR